MAESYDHVQCIPLEKLRIPITGAGGSIASDIARRLCGESLYIIASDWKRNEHMSEGMFCVFYLVDGVTRKWQSLEFQGRLLLRRRHAVKCISLVHGSVDIYPKFKQLETDVSSLKESDALPEDAYVPEKLTIKEFKHHRKDSHIIDGPYGTWKGGRERALAMENFEDVPSSMKSRVQELEYIDSDEMVNIKERGEIVLSSDNELSIHHILGPEGVRGQNLDNSLIKIVLSSDNELSIHDIPEPEGVQGQNLDNSLIKEKLDWAPSLRLQDGLAITYKWLKEQLLMLKKNINFNININININQ